MKGSIRGMFFIVVSIIANNLLWLYSLENTAIANNDKRLLLTAATDNHGGFNPVDNEKQSALMRNILMPECSSQMENGAKVKGRVFSENDAEENTVDQETPFTLVLNDMDVPIELSQDLLNEHAFNSEDFFYTNDEKKIDTIQSLSPQGDDLKLIRKILQNEESSDLRIEALKRLHNEHSYIATNTLVEALDDPEERVVLTALSTIVSNGDRTLIPLLKEKMSISSSNAMRDKYEKSIHRLKFSVTMGMDEIPVERASINN